MYNYKRGRFRNLKHLIGYKLNEENIDINLKIRVEHLYQDTKLNKIMKMREDIKKKKKIQGASKRYNVGKTKYTQALNEVKLGFEKSIINKCTNQLEVEIELKP